MHNEGQRNAPIRETKSIKKGGMILPFQPLSLVFDDIRYAVDVSQVHKKKCSFVFLHITFGIILKFEITKISKWSLHEIGIKILLSGVVIFLSNLGMFQIYYFLQLEKNFIY